jgi:hypothetical protein
MDVQQAAGGADPGSEPPRGSRTGLIVWLLVAALVAAAAFAVLLTRQGDDDPVAVPTDSPTATSEPTTTAEPSPTPTAQPSASPSPTATQSPADVPPLRPDGIGPLELRMTAEQALATGAVTRQDTAGLDELVADQAAFPGLYVGWDPQRDSIESFTVKDGSPITTPDGIGVTSTPADIEAAYGPLVQQRSEDGETWYVVQVDEVGYAFFPTPDELIMVAATDLVLADIRPGQGLF